MKLFYSLIISFCSILLPISLIGQATLERIDNQSDSQAQDTSKQKKERVHKANPDTLYYEDFSDSTLSNWSVVDSSNRGYNWIWTKVYPVGHWRPTTPSLSAPTSANGFICFPADFYNTPYNPPTSGIDTMNGWITSGPIPISPRNQVEIQFRQYLSYCCLGPSINAGIQLQVSSDSLNWTPYYVLSTNARSGSTPNSELQIHDVSSVLAGEDTAYVRFRFSKNGWYYWMVDDLTIMGSLSTDIDEVDIGSNLSIYPNPSNGLFRVEGGSQISQYGVYDLNGRMKKRGSIGSNQALLDLQHLENGIYMIRLIGEKQESVRKLIIQH